MFFEYRRYEANAGKSEALDRRFQDVTLSIFERHNFRVVGFWHTYVGQRALHYILKWESLEQMERAWGAFSADTEWQREKEASERDGQLTRNVENQIWTKAHYSPDI